MHYKTRLGRSTINSSFTFNSNNLIAYKLIPKKVFLEGEFNTYNPSAPFLPNE